MPQLGLGLGLHKGGYRGDAYNDLVKLSTWFIDPARPDLQAFAKLEPRTLPNGVSNGELTPQNVSVDVVINGSSGLVSLLERTNTFRMAISNWAVANNALQATANSGLATSADGNYPVVANDQDVRMINLRLDFMFVSIEKTKVNAMSGATQTEKFLNYLNAFPITFRYQLATPIDRLNTPIKNPILDRKGNANVTMTNVAWTNLDGYRVETINGKTNVFFNLDGVDTFGALNSASAPNPTGSDDFWQLWVGTTESMNRYFGISRNLDSSANAQYGMFVGGNTNGEIVYILNGVSVSVLNLTPIKNAELVYVIFGRIQGIRFLNILGSEVHSSTFTQTITSQPHTQLACRSNSVDGLTKSLPQKGLQGICAMQVAPQGTIDKAKVVATIAKAMKQIYGLGV